MNSQPKVVAVIQARVGSSRLPSKVLRALGGKPVLQWVVEAAQRAKGIDQVVIATSTESGDDAILELADGLGVEVVRGSEDDVLSRFLLAIEQTSADAVVRLTADCPLLDSTVISQVVSLWRQDPVTDYVSTTQVRSLPRGLDVELATAKALRQADERTEPHHRAHVTSALYEEGAPYARAALSFVPRSDHYRATLDTPEDAELLDALVAELGSGEPVWRDVVAVLDARPDIVALNAHIEQKALTEG
ncbi:cytidylyltransferase domain-containing protein [Arthrobacter sp. NPDC090010]|uniref:cytidylyltransferase domain-containing protein n=1 Tax=Arthrobacter sp. NPDC090010 TaxID=3363942 RepID=UPI0037FB08B0